MKISLTDAGKRFNRDWIFRHFSYEFIAGECYAVTGPNGSGKSTLLQTIAGAIALSEGRVEYLHHSVIPGEQAYRSLAMAAPYLDVIEEMTATEFLKFHQQFKPFLPGLAMADMIAMVGLEKAAHKQIRYYSSGMKQRIKLAQAFFSDTPCLLLDEPCTNLDKEGVDLYNRLIREYGKNRLVIVSSNDEQEYHFCKTIMNILDYK